MQAPLQDEDRIMETTATVSVYEQLAEEFPNGCTGEEAQQFMRRAGHSYGCASISLRQMGSSLGSAPGGGMVKSTATRGQKIRSRQRQPKGLNK